MDTYFKTKSAKEDPKQWLGVKLPGDYYVTKVVLKLNAGSCVSSMEGLEVRVGINKAL